MPQPYLGEIRLGGFNYAPEGWAFCDGRLLSINDNDALFALLGTTYGGDGVSTFALPDLRGRIPFHQGRRGGDTLVIGQRAGSETVTLALTELPQHTHQLAASSAAGTQNSPANGVWAQSALDQFSTAAPTQSMAPAAIQPTGQSQPHDNMSPFVVANFIIALSGIYPSQN